jgi:arylsulfatase A-like enzyme
MTDQQFAGAMSCAGNADLHTPAMDFLAGQGVSFKKAYCSNPICVPSRASWITAQYPHTTDITFNVDQRRMTAEPVTPLFKANGYDTGYAGKWHIPHDHKDKKWHGFDYLSNIRNNRVDFDIPKACVDFLKQNRENPFFLVASFVNPHDICEYARIITGISDTLKNGQIPPLPPLNQMPELPANFEIPKDEPSVIRAHQKTSDRTYPAAKLTKDMWRQYRWAYYRMVELVDAEIMKILNYLKETKLIENTLIVFTSDHGDGMGAHQWNQKTLLYDEVARIPLIISHPSFIRAGSQDAITLTNMNIDVLPTLFDFAGIDIPKGLPGKSLKGVIEGNSNADTHDFIVVENDLHREYGFSGGIYGRMVRTGRYKYVCYSEGDNREQLFDMDLDPGEMNSLVNSQDHQTVLSEHRKRLAQWIKDTDDFFKM